MRRLHVSKQSLTAILAALLCLLALLAVAAWLLVTVEAPRVPAPMAYRMPADLAQSVATAEELHQALERPLFWKERRPQVEVEAQEGSAVSADGIRVAGVIVKGGVQTALLETGQGVKRARVGETVSGWRVEAVSGTSVRLISGERSVELDVVPPRNERVRLEPLNRD